MPTQDASPHSRRWLALALLCVAECMVVVDLAIVNVALPAIQEGLRFARGDLQWVVIAYSLFFGGFLMLGGRLADLYGRRRVFLAGLAIFTGASLACGLATSPGALISARALQGLGGALLSPAALAVIGALFREGAERNKALGIWGGVAGASGALGVLLGGVVTDGLGWQWIFLINLPVGLLALGLAFPLIAPDGPPRPGSSFDLPGALLVTGGVGALVFGLARAEPAGWAALETIGPIAAGIAMLMLFVAVERLAGEPLVPLEIFRRSSVVGANVAGLLLGGAFFSTFFFLSLYMQQVLGWSPREAGLAYLPLALIVVVAAVASQDLVSRFGARVTLTAGLILSGAGIAWFTMIRPDGSYLVDLAPGFVLAGVGFGLSFVPVSIAALHRVPEREVGAASGLVNSSQEIGGALGIAVLVTLAAAVSGAILSPEELVSGFRAAFVGGAVICLAAAAAAFGLVPPATGRRAEGDGATYVPVPPPRAILPEAPGPMGHLNPYPARTVVAARIVSPYPLPDAARVARAESSEDGAPIRRTRATISRQRRSRKTTPRLARPKSTLVR